jgi:hypothetical protein
MGAEDGARTRDLNLGKVALYQLSYFRTTHNSDRRILYRESGSLGRATASANLPTSTAEAPITPRGPGQRVRLRPRDPRNLDDHQLSYPVASLKLDRLLAMVDQQDLNFTPVTGVDQTRRVHKPDAAPAGVAAARKHKSGVARWNRNRDSGRDCGSFPGGEDDVVASGQIQPGVTLMRRCRKRYVRIEDAEGNVHRLDQI